MSKSHTFGKTTNDKSEITTSFTKHHFEIGSFYKTRPYH